MLTIASTSVTLTTGFHAQAGSRFSAAVNTTGKVWRRRYYYGNQSSDADARGRLVKVEVNDDMDLCADVIEEYSYDRRGNMLTKKLSILETGDVSTISYKFSITNATPVSAEIPIPSGGC